MKYVELRAHTEFSIGYAVGLLPNHVKRAHEIGMSAFCAAEIDSLRGIYELHKACEKEKIKPIFAVEVAVVPDMTRKVLTDEEREKAIEGLKGVSNIRKALNREERKLGLDRGWRLTLRAMTSEGLANLFRITSIGWTEGLRKERFGTKPRVDMNVLRKFADGIEASAGGLNGLVTEALLAKDSARAVEELATLQDIYGENFHLEVQPHTGLHIGLNKLVRTLAEATDTPVIAVNDTRYINASDDDAHTILLCLTRRNMTLDNPEHPRSQPGFHLRSGEEMAEAFALNHPALPVEWIEQAIERTVEIAEQCSAKLDINLQKALIPAVEMVNETASEEVAMLCEQGWTWRRIPERAARLGIPESEYKTQLKKELDLFKSKKFDPYFLVVRDVIQFCREQDIMVGPGRGSAAASLACYLMGITSLDPLEHKLDFDRFLAENRIDMPDIDTDFDQARREEVIQYLHKKYGADRTCHISSYGRMHGKSAMKDVGRVLGLPFSELNAVTAAFPNKQGDEETPIREILEGSDVGRKFMRQHADALALIEKLEGQVRQIGVHAAGIVCSPVPLSEVCPIEYHARRGEAATITALDMWGAAALGLVKLDILGINNLSVLRDCRRAIKENHGVDVDFESLGFDDGPVIEDFSKQSFIGIFQYDAESARKVSEGVTFAAFQDIAALTALNRPGCTRSGLTDMWKARRQDASRIESVHPIYDEITKDTLGVLVYQEQLVKLFVELGGFSKVDADKVRKNVGKKLSIEKESELFVNGAVERGMPQESAESLSRKIAKFGEYAFNVSHSVAYATVAYWEMWCKVHYPAEFIWALMANALSSEKALGYVKEARRLGIKTEPPNVNTSKARWSLRDGVIHAGLLDVKEVGGNAVTAIVASQPFVNIVEFFEKVPGRAANKRAVLSLVKAGAFRELLPNMKFALENQKLWLEQRNGRAGWQDKILAAIGPSAGLSDYPEDEKLAFLLATCPQGAGRHPMDLYTNLMNHQLSENRWLKLGSPNFMSKGYGTIAGIVTDLKYRQMGDFGDGDREMSEEKKKLKGWGRQFAQVTLEGSDGSTRRVRFDPDVLERFQATVDQGVGARLAVNVSIVSGRFSVIRANYAADLEALRQKLKMKFKLSDWERLFLENPVEVTTVKRGFRHRSKPYFKEKCLIVNMKKTIDRNDNEMAWLTVQDSLGAVVDVTCFSSVWETMGSDVNVGDIVTLRVKREDDDFFLQKDGLIDHFGSIL